MPPEDDDDQHDDQNQDDDDEGGSGDGPDKGKGQKTLTQAEVDRILTRERKAAERKARQALADQFGVPLDQVAEIVKARQEADEAQKTEAQKAREAADKAKADADAAAAKAHQATVRAELKAALLGGDGDEPGVNRQYIADAMELVLPKVLDAGDDLDTVIQAEVEALRKRLPVFFGAAGNGDEDGSNGKKRGGTPGPGRKISERNGNASGQKSRAQLEVERRRQMNKMTPVLGSRPGHE